MFDIWLGSINFTWLMIGVSFILILPIQLLLCFRVKSLTLRLLPIGLSVALCCIFLILALTFPGWYGLLFAMFTIYSAGMVFLCAMGWGIWKLVQILKK